MTNLRAPLAALVGLICASCLLSSAAAVGNIVTDIRSNVEVNNSEANEALDSAECTADNNSSACNDSCHGDNTCNGGEGGEGGAGCTSDLTTVNVGNNNCRGGDGGRGGDSSHGEGESEDD